MKNRFLLRSGFFVILCLIISSVAAGQAGRGMARLKGVVVDEAGKPIPEAKVEIALNPNQEAKHETTTNKKGEWAIIGLSSGSWTVTAVAKGYQPTSIECALKQLEQNPATRLVLKKVPLGESREADKEASLALVEEANKLYEEKKFDEAITSYQKLLDINPTIYQINISIGDCYREKGDYDKAFEFYRLTADKALSDQAQGKRLRAKALARIGEAYVNKGDFENAQDYFKQSIDSFPEDEVLAYNVGEIYFSNQKMDEAINYFTIATQIKPDWSDAYYKLGLAYLNKADYAKAQEILNKFLELEPNTDRSASAKTILDTISKMK